MLYIMVWRGIVLWTLDWYGMVWHGVDCLVVWSGMVRWSVVCYVRYGKVRYGAEWSGRLRSRLFPSVWRLLAGTGSGKSIAAAASVDWDRCVHYNTLVIFIYLMLQNVSFINL